MQFQERKRKRRCQYECKDHIFSLQTLKSNSSKYDIKVQFCPKYQRDPLPPEQTFPEFNEDLKYYTSAFLLGVDKRILVKNQQQELMDHQKQIRDSLEKHNQLIFPRPNSKHSLCSVCKEHYKNYYYHIGSEEHRDRIGLSSYNIHIKQVCSLYVELWEGCEEKADEAAQRRATEEEERMLRMAEAGSEEEYSNSLADCQRGSVEQRYDEDGNPLMSKPKMYRRTSSRNNDDQMPMMGRKRSNPDGRLLYETANRKHLFGIQLTSIHTARERKERNYERERFKMMRGTQFQKYKKDFVEVPGNDDDVFTIMRPVQGSQVGTEVVVQALSEKSGKRQMDETPKKSLDELIVRIEGEDEEVSSLSSSSSIVELEREMVKSSEQERKILSVEQGQLSDSSSSDISDGFFSRRTERIPRNTAPKQHVEPSRDNKANVKIDPRAMHGYNYPYHMPVHPPYMPPHSGQASQAYKAEAERYKAHGGAQPHGQRFKGHPEGYKGVPPNYYYPPYGYPPYYGPQYGNMPQEKGYEVPAADKEKGKGQQKPPYDYPMHYPSWPYPYYMPPQSRLDAPPGKNQPQPQPQPQTSGQNQNQNHNQGQNPSQTPGQNPSLNPNHPYYSNTNININYPLYICPSPSHKQMQTYGMPPPSGYPMHPPMPNPYAGYQPYSYQERNKAEGEYQHRGIKGNQLQYPFRGPQQQHLPPGSNHQQQLPPGSSHQQQQPQQHERYGPKPQGSGQSGHQSQQLARNQGPNPYYYPPNYMQYHHGYQKPKEPVKKDP